jgi:acyl-CoA thioester hydrolase
MSEFLVSIRPRYGEVDRMGVVYHAHYLVYFDIGRTEFMRAHGASYASLEERGYRLAVTEAAVRYRRPALYDQELEIAVWLSRLGRATVTFRYELWDLEGSVLASGHTRLGCIDEAGRPTALPADFVASMGPGSPREPPPSQRS